MDDNYLNSSKWIRYAVVLGALIVVIVFFEWFARSFERAVEEGRKNSHGNTSEDANSGSDQKLDNVSVDSPAAADNEDSIAGAKDEVEELENTDRVVAEFGPYKTHLRRKVVSLAPETNPEVVNWYEVIDSRTGNAVALRDFFDEASIVKAVVGAVEFDLEGITDANYITRLRAIRGAKTQAELSTLLAAVSGMLIFEVEEECSEDFAWDMADTSFAVIDYDAGPREAIVHIGVPSDSASCGSIFPRLRIRLRAPDTLLPMLEAVHKDQKGRFPNAEDLAVCDTCQPFESSRLVVATP